MFQKRQCPDFDFAEDFKNRLLAAGFSEAKVVREFEKWYVYYRRY